MKIELSHDSLARRIYEKASTEDKMLLEKQNFIKNRYSYYLKSKILLDEESLKYIRPYLIKLSLDKNILVFIRKSEAHVNRRSFLIGGVILCSTLILFIFGIQASKTLYDLNINRTNQQIIFAKLEKAKKDRSAAEEKAQALLSGMRGVGEGDLDDVDIVKQMIIQYDTLGKKHLDMTKQRDLAQSATLSDLAVTALEQEDTVYALQLASKAWELNPDNKQTLAVLEKINKQKEIAFAEYSSNKQASLVLELQAKEGKLEEKDLKVIFSKENKVAQNPDLGIKKSVDLTAVNLEIEEEAGMSVPSLYRNIQQGESKKSILEAVEESLAPVKENENYNCSLAQRDVDKWLPIKETRVWSLFVKYASDGKLYMRIIFNETKKEHTLPNLVQLMINSAFEVKVIPLVGKTTSKGNKIYKIDLSEEDEDWLKDERIIGFSFSVEEVEISKYQAFEEEFLLEEQVQNKLINMGKCLL